jgi:hypothetical protein
MSPRPGVTCPTASSSRSHRTRRRDCRSTLVTRGDAKIDYRRYARACERYNRFTRHLPSPSRYCPCATKRHGMALTMSALGALQGQALGDGTVFRAIRQAQRKFFYPPEFDHEPHHRRCAGSGGRLSTRRRCYHPTHPLLRLLSPVRMIHYVFIDPFSGYQLANQPPVLSNVAATAAYNKQGAAEHPRVFKEQSQACVACIAGRANLIPTRLTSFARRRSKRGLGHAPVAPRGPSTAVVTVSGACLRGRKRHAFTTGGFCHEKI